jgi:dTDP-4-dehydrorhamnose 3,5-epimerase-like enzyme
MMTNSKNYSIGENGLRFAANCSISIDASFGAQCVVDFGAVVCAGVKIGNRVTIGPNVVFVEGASGARTIVQDNVHIGAGTVVYAGVTLAAGALVRPGTVVTRSVPHGAIVEGNPAMIVGYVNAHPSGGSVSPIFNPAKSEPVEDIGVGGVQVFRFPVIPDLRGNLTVGEFEKQIPFKPLRYFMVYGVPSREIRGEHAHHQCHQFLICMNGSCAVVADDGKKRAEVVLDSPHKGLYLPPKTWGIQYKYSSDALLLVFASHAYDPADYIRDYNDFVDMVTKADADA